MISSKGKALIVRLFVCSSITERCLRTLFIEKKASRGKLAGRETFEGKCGFQRFPKWSEVKSTVRPQLAAVRCIAFKGKLLAESVKTSKASIGRDSQQYGSYGTWPRGG